jgi:hypothetical protein
MTSFVLLKDRLEELGQVCGAALLLLLLSAYRQHTAHSCITYTLCDV